MPIPHYGKRDPGGLTAGNPGDKLFFAFGAYADSGDSEALTGLAVTDIELFKNGNAVARATDSGYSLISDTGQIGDRVGLYRCSVELFNTSDDTGFYDAGSWYQAAIDAVTIDGKTVRFWLGSFEIGTPRANLIEVKGDTGQAVHLGQMADEYDTGRLPADAGETLDTGSVNQAVWQADGVRVLTANTNLAGLAVDATQLVGDTGAAAHLAQLADEHDTGRLQAEASATLDTGAVNQAVWQADALRTLTNIDTGAALHLAQMADEYDTGRLPAEATATLDTGAVNQAVWQADASRTLTEFAFDTGVQQAIERLDTGLSETMDRTLAKVDTGVSHDVWGAPTRTLTAFAFDTGLQERIDRLDTGVSETIDRILADTDTGTLDANVISIDGDTGFADRIGKFASVLSGAGQIDTGTLAGTQAGTIDANITYVNETAVAGTGDTGAGDTWRPA